MKLISSSIDLLEAIGTLQTAKLESGEGISNLARMGILTIEQQQKLGRDHGAFDFIKGTFLEIIKSAQTVEVSNSHGKVF